MKCMGVDFDGTLVHFTDPHYNGLFEIYTRRGIPRGAVERCYGEVKGADGFSPDKLTSRVAETTGISLDAESISDEYGEWWRTHLIPYEESILQVTFWMRNCGIPVVIVTAGDAIYQREKVLHARIPHDQLITVPRVNEKAAIMSELLARYGAPIAVFDDKASELDALRDAGLDESCVMTIWIRRPDSRYRDQMPKYRHLTVERLDDPVLDTHLGAPTHLLASQRGMPTTRRLT